MSTLNATEQLVISPSFFLRQSETVSWSLSATLNSKIVDFVGQKIGLCGWYHGGDLRAQTDQQLPMELEDKGTRSVGYQRARAHC